MNRYWIALLCVPVVGLLGCQTVLPTPPRYVQRDLTAPWVGHTYWSVPAPPTPDLAMPVVPGAQRTVTTPRSPRSSPAITCTGEAC